MNLRAEKIYRKGKIVTKEMHSILPLLLSRLERISANSRWAHRASGIRGALLELLESIEAGEQVPQQKLKRLMEQGFYILGKAAKKK